MSLSPIVVLVLFALSAGGFARYGPDPQLVITILYDNQPYEPGLTTGWGFAAFVERGGNALLFDTGGDGAILLANAAALDVDLARARAVVLSHPHGDHTGGLAALLESGLRPVVYVTPSFPASFKREVRRSTRLVELGPGDRVAPGVHTTGELGGSIPEQALVIETDSGLVVLTGCAHPGITTVVAEAKAQQNGDVRLVMGGFHLRHESPAEVDAVVRRLRELGVQRVAPTHCTGDAAIARFRAAWGSAFLEAGVGRVVRIGGEVGAESRP